jgi:translation elongation factor EF-Tu-like GTPase
LLVVLLIALTGGTTASTFTHSKAHVDVGVLGQEDHGTAALTSAITKVLSEARLTNFIPVVEIKRAPEERERGITIAMSRVEYETEKRHYAHVYFPKHADYIKNMLTGAARMDGAILVVSSEDGPTSQTEEHVRLASLTGGDNISIEVELIAPVAIEKGLRFAIREVIMALRHIMGSLYRIEFP